MGEMDVKPFIWAGLIGRGLRFGLEALVIGIYGQVALDKMMWLLDHEMIIGRREARQVVLDMHDV